MLNKMSEINLKARSYRKQINKKALLKDLSYGVLPLFATAFIVACAYLMMISLVFLYFIYPLYYTVFMRLSTTITGYGPKNFTYKDGYRKYYPRVSGIFPFFVGIVVGYIIFFALENLIINYAFYPYYHAFYPDSYDRFLEYISANSSAPISVLLNGAGAEAPYFINVMMNLTSIISFVPFSYMAFMCLRAFDHVFAAMFTLPDSGSNMSGMQLRQFGKRISLEPVKKDILIARLLYCLPIFIICAGTYYGVWAGIYKIILTDSSLYSLLFAVPLVCSWVVFSIFVPFYMVMMYSTILALMPNIAKATSQSEAILAIAPFYNPNYVHTEDYKGLGLFYNSDFNSYDIEKRSQEIINDFVNQDIFNINPKNGEDNLDMNKTFNAGNDQSSEPIDVESKEVSSTEIDDSKNSSSSNDDESVILDFGDDSK